MKGLASRLSISDASDASTCRVVKLALLSLHPSLQEDSSDLKCQLHFAKEESALMCKKLTKLVKDSEAMKEELAKYRSLYGDVNASLTVEEVSKRGGVEHGQMSFERVSGERLAGMTMKQEVQGWVLLPYWYRFFQLFQALQRPPTSDLRL